MLAAGVKDGLLGRERRHSCKLGEVTLARGKSIVDCHFIWGKVHNSETGC